MKSVGIVAEYNPLHNGHKYHIEESKKLAGADAVVVAMSGNYVQRGEPAILDKWERARLAVLNGADVVVEIPALFCLGDSSVYANAAVKILESLGAVNYLSFGSESGNIDMLRNVANNLTTHKDLINDKIAELVREHGLNYPRAREEAYTSLFNESNELSVLSNNDNLAISYLMAVHRLEPIAVKRIGALYSESIEPSLNFQSASGIRQAIYSNKEISPYVPLDVYNSICERIVSKPEDWFKSLKFAILSKTAEDIDACPSGGEGLGNKIKAEITAASSWDDLILRVKSKRYTYTRLTRLCMQIILGVNRNEWVRIEPEYIKILALSSRGRQLISFVEKNELNDLPIITNINKQKEVLNYNGKKLLAFEAHTTDIYNLVTGRDQKNCSEYRMKPSIQE